MLKLLTLVAFLFVQKSFPFFFIEFFLPLIFKIYFEYLIENFFLINT
jgi:hypothetical protein